MGVRAFVARRGWHQTPISADEWREAVSTLPELDVHRGADPGSVRAVLRGSRRRSVIWHNGYLCGEQVDERLVAVMFVLADRLGAQVYSERRRAYLDLDDFRQRVRRRSRQTLASAAQGPMRSEAGSAIWMPFAVGAGLVLMLVTWALQPG